MMGMSLVRLEPADARARFIEQGRWASGAPDAQIVDLSAHEFEGLDLSGLDLCEVFSRESVFLSCSFAGSDLYAADFSGSRFEAADFSAILGVKATFHGVWAQGARFDGANLNRADFIGCDLRGASFRGATMRGATLSDCDLRGADLTGLDLRMGYFGENQLEGAIGLETMRRPSDPLEG